ncbi:hypothetical protein SODALDRAFT_335254 [Sodiomyces alkalinus F11]|uniref:TATA element modulatory factor 1 TATA binding domain-containing protein n=1 Tax=Sodiomyces alkalinus (strain CBS 110278 / VKM F-3762 / F11) TaxID=1314773 RepID=A0A3N2PRB0_SODAK|nr:hypothetical protein SODALDRAFT_335254 [Sodiomyces alkalinus F11]ROT37037.1 hypothetical protein SODALDRAFT_335254 [Sodiomyces alkalinus F11]
MSNSGTGSRWGSFLSQAVAGMEAHLDNMLAEGNGTMSVSKSTESSTNTSTTPATPYEAQGKPVLSKPLSNNNRTHDRLQQRLAKVVASENNHSPSNADTAEDRPRAEIAGSASVGNPETPSSRNSGEIASRPCQTSPVSNDLPKQPPSPPSTPMTASVEQSEDREYPSLPSKTRSLDDSDNGPRPLSSERPATRQEQSKPPPSTCQNCVAYEARMSDLKAEQQKETHRLVEQIDALQARLQYLAREASLSAKKYVAESAPGTAERKLAEKDEKIYLLMEEGRSMAVTEQRHRNIIKKLKTELSTTEKTAATHQEKYTKAEAKVEALQTRVAQLDELEEVYDESQRQLSSVCFELEFLQAEVVSKDATIADLRRQVHAALDETESASSKNAIEALRAEQQRNRELNEAIDSLKTEKSLVVEDANKRVADFADKADKAAERAKAVEVELRNELQAMEGRLEAMRALAEETSAGVVGDTHGKLLRQIETLQAQHAIALENWQGIEASLIARVGSLETERDDARQRESDMRKKAREMAFRCKCLEEEVENLKDKIPTREQQEELKALRERFGSLEKRAEAAEKEVANARAEADKQQIVCQSDRGDNFDRRLWLEEIPAATSRVQSRPQSPLLSIPTRTYSSDLLMLQGAPSRTRKISTPGSMVDGTYDSLPSARRLSSQAHMRQPVLPINAGLTSAFMISLEESQEPKKRPASHGGRRDEVFDTADTFSSSPRQITQDLASVSTAGAGPSVQLVERMSAAIRRLEAEKVVSREELARISSQRDEARAELAALMKEVQVGKAASKKVSDLEVELGDINSRYQTTLELLGEKSELVEELRADVEDVKAMYRELVERTLK